MKRRDFLKYSSALTALPLVLNGQSIFALPHSYFLESLTSLRPDRKLVLIQLNGGNDGLATFVPLDNYDALQRARSNIIIPEAKLAPFTDTIGLHPSFSSVKNMFDEEKLLVIQGVGYPQPNLSHFRSKDIVTMGSSSDVILQSGWMGRMLNKVHPDYPEGYPGESNPHPIALTIGSSNSPTCQGYASNLGIVIKNLSTSYTSPENNPDFPDSPFGKELEYISGAMRQTEKYLEAIESVAENAQNQSSLYPEGGENSLADQLGIVARLIAGGMQTQVYVVSLGGWDTHSEQAEDGVPEGGRHQELLGKLSEALVAFQDDLKLLAVEDDVMGFVYTEFGRRIKSNASFGTDHGTSWPAIIFGSKVNPAVLGSNPVIPNDVENKDNLPMQFDFRSVYASIFKHWFEAEDIAIEEVLFDRFDLLPILKEETSDSIDKAKKDIRIYPNPVENTAYIEVELTDHRTTIELYTAGGHRHSVLSDRKLGPGIQTIPLDLSFLTPGSYYLVIRNGASTSSTPIIKK